jgi:hypothetical protein
VIQWLWRYHSLTIVFLILGLVTYGAGIAGHWLAPEWLETRDFLRNLGHGFFPLALYNMLSKPLREVNKPDE